MWFHCIDRVGTHLNNDTKQTNLTKQTSQSSWFSYDKPNASAASDDTK